MVTNNTHEKSILGLSFHKGLSEKAFYDFEQLIVYGVQQTLNFFTDLVFLDYAATLNRISLDLQLSAEAKVRELIQLSKRYHCDYVLYGKMEPDIGSSNQLNGIHLELYLFHAVKGIHPLRLHYYFSAFDGKLPQPNAFEPAWEGLQDLVKWMTFQIIGAIQPERAIRLWSQCQYATLAYTLDQYRKLAETHYFNGDDTLQHKRTVLASLTLEEPNLFLAHHELGLVQKRLTQYSSAIEALEHAYKLMKGVTPRQLALCATEIGICHALIQNHEHAHQWWKTAIFDDPTYLNPYINLAHALEEQGNIVEAEAYFKKASEIAPNDTRVFYNLARLYSKLELWDQAITSYERQMALEPNNAWLHSNLANCYLQKGRIPEAKSHLLRTVELDPDGEAGRCANFILSGLLAAEV